MSRNSSLPSSVPVPVVAMTAATALGLLVLGAMAMGISPVFVRNAEVGPFASAFWRVALALPFLAIWSHATSPTTIAPASGRAGGPYRAVVLAGLFFAGDLTFWHLAILNTSIANATFFACMAPIWVALLSRFTLGESVPRQTLVGLGVCVAGAALLILHSSGDGSSHLAGDLYGIVTSLFFGLYFLAMRGARRHMNAGRTTFLSSVVTAGALLAIVLVSGEGLVPGSISGAANLLLLGLVSHAGGQGLLAVALGVLSASFSSLVIFIEAIAAALFGWMFAGERPGLFQLGGGMLVLVGIWIARPKPTSAT